MKLEDKHKDKHKDKKKLEAELRAKLRAGCTKATDKNRPKRIDLLWLKKETTPHENLKLRIMSYGVSHKNKNHKNFLDVFDSTYWSSSTIKGPNLKELFSRLLLIIIILVVVTILILFSFGDALPYITKGTVDDWYFCFGLWVFSLLSCIKTFLLGNSETMPVGKVDCVKSKNTSNNFNTSLLTQNTNYDRVGTSTSPNKNGNELILFKSLLKIRNQLWELFTPPLKVVDIMKLEGFDNDVISSMVDPEFYQNSPLVHNFCNKNAPDTDYQLNHTLLIPYTNYLTFQANLGTSIESTNYSIITSAQKLHLQSLYALSKTTLNNNFIKDLQTSKEFRWLVTNSVLNHNAHTTLVEQNNLLRLLGSPMFMTDLATSTQWFNNLTLNSNQQLYTQSTNKLSRFITRNNIIVPDYLAIDPTTQLSNPNHLSTTVSGMVRIFNRASFLSQSDSTRLLKTTKYSLNNQTFNVPLSEQTTVLYYKPAYSIANNAIKKPMGTGISPEVFTNLATSNVLKSSYATKECVSCIRLLFGNTSNTSQIQTSTTKLIK